jgi:hypothetical protein
MKAMRAIWVLVILLIGIADLSASGLVGIYGIVEKVVFEPSEKSPERIQIWGAFSFVNGGVDGTAGTSKPQRGYLYFTLPSGSRSDQLAVKTEWTDLKTVAGTGQAVGFGSWFYGGPFEGFELRSRGSNTGADVRVRPESEKPAGPAFYNTDAGIIKLSEQGSHADIVKQLKAVLGTR